MFFKSNKPCPLRCQLFLNTDLRLSGLSSKLEVVKLWHAVEYEYILFKTEDHSGAMLLCRRQTERDECWHLFLIAVFNNCSLDKPESGLFWLSLFAFSASSKVMVSISVTVRDKDSPRKLSALRPAAPHQSLRDCNLLTVRDKDTQCSPPRKVGREEVDRVPNIYPLMRGIKSLYFKTPSFVWFPPFCLIPDFLRRFRLLKKLPSSHS